MARYGRWNPPPLHWKEFTMQRFNAQRRGIKFKLTFEQWLSIWMKSGHFSDRGKGTGKYCMARFGDKGAYEVGNVEVVLFSKNCADYVATPAVREARGAAHRGKPKSRLHRMKIGLPQVGRVFSEETRRKMSIAAKNRRT